MFSLLTPSTFPLPRLYLTFRPIKEAKEIYAADLVSFTLEWVDPKGDRIWGETAADDW